MPLRLVLQGRQVLERPVRPILIVLLFPNLQLCPRIRQILEPVHVQALLPQAPVERLNVGIIRRLARPRELQGNLVGIRPEIYQAPGKFWTIVTTDGVGLAPGLNEAIQDLHNLLRPETRARDRG